MKSLVLVSALLVLVAACGEDDSSSEGTAEPTATAPAKGTATSTVTPTPTPATDAPTPTAATPPATATPAPATETPPLTSASPQAATFGDGTYIVGGEIEPGRYRATDLSAFCTWERLSGFGGTFDEILAIDLPAGVSAIVDILPDDTGFSTEGCGEWTPDLAPVTGSPDAPFGDGTYLVGADVAAATLRAPGGDFCSWARLAGFSGDFEDVTAIDIPSGPAVVTISDGDVGFETEGCGEWTADLSPITSSPDAPFGDGTYLVGVDIAAGTWRSEGGEFCAWTRLAGFSGDFDEIIAIDIPTGPTIVSISPSDRGFEADGCGEWSFDG